MAVCCVDYNSIYSGFNECSCTLKAVGRNADAGSYTKTSKIVLACVRLVLCLGDIFVCYQTDESSVSVNHGKFFDFVVLENFCCFFEVGRLACGDDIVLCHHFIDYTVEVFLKAKVTICNNTHESHIIVNHRYSTNLVFLHHVERIDYARSLLDGYGVVNHAIFSALHGVNLAGLFLNAHVFVDNTNAAFASNRDCKLSLGYGIHCCRHERNVKGDVTRELGFEIHIIRQDFRICRNQKDIIECESFHFYSICNK